MRVRWLLLLMFVLAGCGQPLQIGTPTVRATLPAVSPSAGSGASAPRQTASTGGFEQQTATSGIIQPTSIATAPAVTISPAITSVVIVPRTPVPQSNEQRWRAQQLDRQVFAERRLYRASQPVPLLWFDPLTSQSVEIGTLIGSFPAQAQFTLRQSNQPALEVPYRINNDFGLTAISEAIRERMRAAGYTESVETFIVQTEAVAPQP